MDPFYGDLSKMPKKIGLLIKKWRDLRKNQHKLEKNMDISRRDKRNNSRDPNKVKSTDEYEHNLYFKVSIALNKDLNLKKKLAKEGIKPSPKRFKLKKL